MPLLYGLFVVLSFCRYSLIARGKVVLAEKGMINGNFPTIGRVLLNKVKPTDTKMSFVYEK